MLVLGNVEIDRGVTLIQTLDEKTGERDRASKSTDVFDCMIFIDLDSNVECARCP